jgi:hypothetical protein
MVENVNILLTSNCPAVNIIEIYLFIRTSKNDYGNMGNGKLMR